METLCGKVRMRKVITAVLAGASLAFVLAAPALAQSDSSAAAAARAKRKAKTYTLQVSGDFVTAYFSFDGKALAGLTTVAGKTSRGEAVTAQAVYEYNSDGNNCTVLGGAPDAGSEFSLVGGSSVIRFSNGDLQYGHATSAIECIDFSSGPPFPFAVTATEAITGGTGTHAATGTDEITGTGMILVYGAGGVFGAVQFKGTASLN